jgi:hypothetical protein
MSIKEKIQSMKLDIDSILNRTFDLDYTIFICDNIVTSNFHYELWGHVNRNIGI